jgi:hypothetical protein
MDGLGHVVGPLVGQLVGVDLDRGRVLGEDGRPERPGGLGSLAGQGGLPAAGGHGADLGQLPVALGLEGVGGLPLRGDLGLIGRQLVGTEVPGLFGGPGQDLIGGSPGRRPLLLQLLQQVRHGRHLVVPVAQLLRMVLRAAY